VAGLGLLLNKSQNTWVFFDFFILNLVLMKVKKGYLSRLERIGDPEVSLFLIKS
jgi:hypothetical protein